MQHVIHAELHSAAENASTTLCHSAKCLTWQPQDFIVKQAVMLQHLQIRQKLWFFNQQVIFIDVRHQLLLCCWSELLHEEAQVTGCTLSAPQQPTPCTASWHGHKAWTFCLLQSCLFPEPLCCYPSSLKVKESVWLPSIYTSRKTIDQDHRGVVSLAINCSSQSTFIMSDTLYRLPSSGLIPSSLLMWLGDADPWPQKFT